MLLLSIIFQLPMPVYVAFCASGCIIERGISIPRSFGHKGIYDVFLNCLGFASLNGEVLWVKDGLRFIWFQILIGIESGIGHSLKLG